MSDSIFPFKLKESGHSYIAQNKLVLPDTHPNLLKALCTKGKERGGCWLETHHTPTPYPPQTHPGGELISGRFLQQHFIHRAAFQQAQKYGVDTGWVWGGSRRDTHPAENSISTKVSAIRGGCRLKIGSLPSRSILTADEK